MPNSIRGVRRVVLTNAAPAAIGPYSQAIELEGFVYSSGQVGIDPGTGAMVEGGVVAETHQVLRNLKAVFEAAGCSLADVLKTTVFLADMGDFAAMNEVYAAYFADQPPARSTIGVAALPRGASVEIEAIARVPAKRETGADVVG